MKLLKERENAVKLETEMDIAAQIQLSLLSEKPEIEGYDITAYMKPADDNLVPWVASQSDLLENDWKVIEGE